MSKFAPLILALLCVLSLTACGDFPAPFQGRPGAEAQRLAQPTAPLLVIPPPETSVMPADARQAFAVDLAKSLAEHEVPAQAKRPSASEWRLASKWETRGTSIVPTFTIEDPTGKSYGSAEGPPATADAWAVGSPDFLRKVVVDVTPKVIDLLTAIRVTRDRADPNSLLNRPPKAMVAEVTGAPGDGNAVLTRQVRDHLKAYGIIVQTDKVGADFYIKGEVTVVPVPGKKERVEIVWTVSVPSGDERGKVVQLNEIPAGILSHYWGEVALVVATEAASGLHDVIDRQSGRTDAAALAAKAKAANQPH